MYTQEEIIQIFNDKHNYKYDYSKVEFSKVTTKVCIICPEHGEFWQEPRCHIKGQGCPICGKIKKALSKTDNIDNFLIKARNKHGEKFTYEKSVYINNSTKIIVNCKKHGYFNIRPDMLLQGHGCPECKKDILSKKNNKILKEIIEFISKDIGVLNYEIISKNEVYFEYYKITIRLLSLTEDNEIKHIHRNVHKKINDEHEKNNKQVIQIFEDEWINKNEICKSRLMGLFFKIKNKIYARKCIIKPIDNKTAKEFCKINHIQGDVNSKISLGLYYNTELISVMTFGALRKNLGSQHKDNCYELLRFCNKLNTIAVGGAGKLFNYFIKNYNPIEIISYADRRWSVGKLYNTLGFKEIRTTEPNYFYIIDNKRKNRFSYRKDILIKKYGCLKEDTEHNFCFSKGWYRIYDCGCKVFIWNKINKG